MPPSLRVQRLSSSLVFVPLQIAQVDPSSTTNEADSSNILCPAEMDGSGNTSFAADNMTLHITIRTFPFLSASGVRLGNTFQPSHGTTSFRFEYIVHRPNNRSECYMLGFLPPFRQILAPLSTLPF